MFPYFLSLNQRFSLTRLSAAHLLAFAALIALAFNWGSARTIMGIVLSDHWMFYIDPLVRFEEFALGILLGLAHFTIDPRTLSKATASIAEAASCALLIGVALLAGHAVPKAVAYSLLYVPAFSAIVFVFSLERGVFSSLLTGRVMALLGEASFMLYLLHVPLLDYVGRVFHHLGVMDATAIAAVSAAIAVPASIVLHLRFEQPARHYVTTWLTTRQGILAAAPTQDRPDAGALPADDAR